jgi:hypothetical protein
LEERRGVEAVGAVKKGRGRMRRLDHSSSSETVATLLRSSA